MAVAILVAGFAMAGCGRFDLPGPLPPDLANQVESSMDDATLVWTVRPWPLDEPVAYLCVRDPADTFSGPDPRLVADAACDQVEAVVHDDALTVRADRSTLMPELAVVMGIGQPVYLAITGRRGGVSASTVVQVIDPLITTSPGPTG